MHSVIVLALSAAGFAGFVALVALALVLVAGWVLPAGAGRVTGQVVAGVAVAVVALAWAMMGSDWRGLLMHWAQLPAVLSGGLEPAQDEPGERDHDEHREP